MKWDCVIHTCERKPRTTSYYESIGKADKDPNAIKDNSTCCLAPQLTFFGVKEIGDHAPGPCATQAAGLHITPAATRWILRMCFRDISHGAGIVGLDYASLQSDYVSLYFAMKVSMVPWGCVGACGVPGGFACQVPGTAWLMNETYSTVAINDGLSGLESVTFEVASTKFIVGN